MSASVKDFLGPKGVLVRDGLEFRRPQLEMAEAVEEALSASKPLLIEAGTGVGKSLAYLLPAALAAHAEGLHILVSTHTKALQEQLVRKDLPFLSRVLVRESIPISFALFMGSENYLCLRRFYQSIRDANALFASAHSVETLGRLKTFVEGHTAKKGQSGLRMDLPDAPDDLWRNIHRESDNCMASHSPYYQDCYHHAAYSRLKGSDLLVVNHALFFANLASGGKVLPAYDAVILDEAHSIEEVAASHLGLNVTNFSIKWQLDQIYNPSTEKGLARRFETLTTAWRRAAMDQVRQLRRKTDEFFERLIEAFKTAPGSNAFRVRKPEPIPNTLTQPLDDLSGHLREGRDKLEAPEDKQEMKAYADRLTGLAATLESFLTQSDRQLVYWIEIESRPRGTRVQLRASPLDLSRALKATLFREDAPPAILTSATLTVQNDFEFVQSRIGASGILGVELGSPFNYERQCLLYLPKEMPDPGEDAAYYQAVEDQCRRLIELAGGGVFILCTSHDWVNRLFCHLSEKLADHKFFKQGGPKSFGMLDEFRRTPAAVLIGTDTFWQGVDVPGEALRLVIVTRLPFALPSHPLEEARVEYLRSAGFDPFTRHTLPSAVLMLRQGFGRLIRRIDDRGVVAILDPRIRTRAYGQVFLKSLPPARRAAGLAEVKVFLSKSAAGEPIRSERPSHGEAAGPDTGSTR